MLRFTFLTCPNCTLRGVYPKLGTDDAWVCRYCGWNAYMSGESNFDRYNRWRLARDNAHADIWVTDSSAPIVRPNYLESEQGNA